MEKSPRHTCPGCGGREIERVPRRRTLDRLVRLVGRAVYRCLACDRRFYDRPITDRQDARKAS
jgi:DNA-directed RNA polymerase subunit RPC12/RpoP